MNQELINKIKQLRYDIKVAELSNNYNNGLAFELTSVINKLKSVRDELSKEYYEAPKNSEEEKQLYEQGILIVGLVKEFNDALAKENAKNVEKSTGAVLGTSNSKVDRDEEVKAAKKKGKRAGIAIGAVVAAAVLAVAGLAYHKNKGCLPAKEESSITEVQEETTTEKDETTKHIFDTVFTDPSDDKQVEARAKEIYDKYININNIPNAAKAQLTVEEIEDILRMSNGEFNLVNGEPSYNAEDIDKIANDINSIYNYTSFKQLGTDLVFVPSAIFFTDGSVAQYSAIEADKLLEKVYTDIRNNNNDAFVQDSISWGEYIRDTYIQNDSTGETISIWQVDSPTGYYLGQALTSPYGPSIMEYCGANCLNICVPYCYETGSSTITSVPLSQIIYDINNTPLNDLAVRAGRYEEWKDLNHPIMWELGNNADEFYTYKAETELGHAKTLK